MLGVVCYIKAVASANTIQLLMVALERMPRYIINKISFRHNAI